MKYDFENLPTRFGSSCEKWDHFKKGDLPMWVADMDFPCAPAIVKAIQNRASHPIFGYADEEDESWKKAYQHFFKVDYDFDIPTENMLFSIGVVCTLSSFIHAFTKPGDGVIVFSPSYNRFYSVTENNGRKVVDSPLLFDGKKWSINFALLEQQMKDNKALILCNPHNPIGKAWEKENLVHLAKLAKENKVKIFADEIHAPISKTKYVPFFASCSEAKEIAVMAISAGKGFNTAGIKSSVCISFNSTLFAAMKWQLNIDENNDPSIWAFPLIKAAFMDSLDYLHQTNEAININRDFAREFIAKEIPEITFESEEATYLIWLNVSKVANDSSSFADYLYQKTGLYINKGEIYGDKQKSHIRMNLGTSLSNVKDGLARLKEAVKSYPKL